MLEHSDFKENERDLRGVPSLSLAYLGDGVYEVLVREYLVACIGCNPHEIHKKALEYVSAPAQAAAAKKIMEHLTEEENSVFRRGRNTKVHAIPKSATAEQYHAATGLECLFGYLYLTGQNRRIGELFDIITGE